MIIPINTSTGKYDIILERGSLENLGKFLKLKRKVLIVTDSKVPTKYSDTVAKQCGEPFVVTIPEGESSKSFENYKMLLEKMLKNGFTRSDCVVAVGGGVVGDLSGFVASSYMRGIDFYNIPTTVLSQVDSSVGGKVAIDFLGFKNIVGSFYPPKAVVIDGDTLKTLPKRQISNGLAEAVKMSLTSNKELFSVFENEDIESNLDLIIKESIMIKKAVVEADEKEMGIRKILNFGHTLAHAIESQNEMQDLYHGECVALGMLSMCSDEVRQRLLKVLNKLNLPTSIVLKNDKILEAVSHDKKKSGESISVVYVDKIGSYEIKSLLFEELKEILVGVNKI